jgi:hypothetical protein
VNALADGRVADYLNDTFVSTYLKVGTFQIINGQKVGGNVASYFCLADGSVIHAIPGKMDADKLLAEARWAYETRKSALTFSTSLATGEVNMKKYQDQVKRVHTERFHAELNGGAARLQGRPLPLNLPRNVNQQAQAHWLLGTTPLAKIDEVYPVVWTEILREQLSGLPVAKR